jgi:hypothetical protein
MSREKEMYEKLYPAGTIIELLEEIEDPYTPKPAGAWFEVSGIDDELQLHGRWLPPERGSLAVDIKHDKFKVV